MGGDIYTRNLHYMILEMPLPALVQRGIFLVNGHFSMVGVHKLNTIIESRFSYVPEGSPDLRASFVHVLPSSSSKRGAFKHRRRLPAEPSDLRLSSMNLRPPLS